MHLRLLAMTLLVAATGCGRPPTTPGTSPEMPKDLIPELPDVQGFRRAAQSLAALDAILSPDSSYRRYSFDTRWGDGEMMASMRDGSGDHWFAVITAAGIALHGLAHEAATFEPGQPKPWVFAELPEAFHQSLLREPAFDCANSTYCCWRLTGDSAWRRGAKPDDVDDGHAEHLAVLVGGASSYLAWAQENYEVTLASADVAAVFAHRATTSELAHRLNPDVDFESLQQELRGIGYP